MRFISTVDEKKSERQIDESVAAIGWRRLEKVKAAILAAVQNLAELVSARRELGAEIFAGQVDTPDGRMVLSAAIKPGAL
jgi:hypothetical protein